MESDSSKDIFEQYAELVRRFKAGDENAFTEIYEKSKRLVYTTCYGILNNEQDAEDATQETYTAVFLKLTELKDENVFLQWLKRIAANKARDKYKVRKGDLSYDDTVAAGEDIEGDDNLEDLPDSYVMDKTKRDALHKIIKESLKDAEYQTVLLFYYDEFSRKDIAEVMGCSEETVKDRLSKSRKKIKAGITEYERVNKDKLMGAAAGVPFLTRFFTESFKDIPVPQTKFIPPKAVPNASPAGAVKGTAAKAVVKAGEKAVVQSAVKAGFLATATGKIVAVVTAIVVALGAVVTGAILIKRSKDNGKRDYKINYDGIYSFVDEDENVNNCLRFYPDGDLIYTSYEFDEDDAEGMFPTGSWFTIESDDDRVDEGTYEVEDGELVINIDHDPDPIIFTGELDETGVILTPESDPDADPLVYEFVSFDDLPDYEPEEEEFILDRTVMNWNGHSYALFDGYGSWEEAEAYCESMGGHLAVITSQEENDAIYAFAQSMSCDNVYIGYSDTAEEGVWAWVNGEESDYANWNEGEPNGFTAEENYAVLGYNGCWYDSAFTPAYENGPIVFVCEWDSEVTGTENISADDIVLPEPEETEPVETEPVETDPETFAPVLVPLSEIPDYDQLEMFVTHYTLTDDAYVYAGNSLYILEGGPSPTPLIYTFYFDDITLSDNHYHLTLDELVWIERNILNLSDEQISSLNSDADSRMDSDGRISFYNYSGTGDYVSIVMDDEVWFDGKYYYVSTELGYCEGDSYSTWNIYFTLEYKNIDGRDFWTLISSTDEPFDFSNSTGNSTGSDQSLKPGDRIEIDADLYQDFYVRPFYSIDHFENGYRMYFGVETIDSVSDDGSISTTRGPEADMHISDDVIIIDNTNPFNPDGIYFTDASTQYDLASFIDMVNTDDPYAQPDLFMRVAEDDRTEIVLIVINP